MRQRIRISPERYFVVAAVALVALTIIVFTGAAVGAYGVRYEWHFRSGLDHWSAYFGPRNKAPAPPMEWPIK